MSALRTGLLLPAFAFAVAACAAAPAVAPVEETLEDRIQAVRESLEAARNETTDFAGTLIRMQGTRRAVYRIMMEVQDPDQRRDLGIVDLAVRADKDWRAFIQEGIPPEAYQWLRSAARSRAEGPEAGTLDEARQYFFGRAQQDLFEQLARSIVPESDSAELDRIIRADPADLTAADKDRAKRLAAMRKLLMAELIDCWVNRDRRGGCTTSYGSGTILVLGRPAGREAWTGTPEQWWEAATAREREEWLLSMYAEKGGFLEVARKWDEPCGSCEGRGSKEDCRACNGSGSLLKVRWR